jgi:cyclic pyranopterin phosphate synthase
MTTNGVRLAGLAKDLKNAGLKRVNISLDSLKEERFSQITGGGQLKHVLAGIEAALEVGLTPVKVNVVTVKGTNDDEIADFIKLTKDLPIYVRFIELMPMGSFGETNRDKVLLNTEILSKFPELEAFNAEVTGEPAKYYKVSGYEGLVGLISPMSHRFCDSCNRIRLTCDGKIRPCLGNNSEVDIYATLKNEPGKLADVVREAIFHKPAGHHFDKGFSSVRSMDNIGG